MRPLTHQEVCSTIMLYSDDPLRILAECGGFYDCPKDENGKRLGPLVGYAGTYGPDSEHYVGNAYADFAAAEQYPAVMQHYAKSLCLTQAFVSVGVSSPATTVCGAPMGGLSIANMIALTYGYRYTYMEKKVVELASKGCREKSKLVFGRHMPVAGERVALAEDVTNNLSTADQMIALLREAGCHVVAIISLLNRSTSFDTFYETGDVRIPIISLVRKKIDQYKQDDPAVAADIASGNVVWKPKLERNRLQELMRDSASGS